MSASRKSGKKPGVYLLLGPENGQKQEFIDQLTKKIASESGEKPEEYRYYPFKLEFLDVVSTLRNTSLFAAHRIVFLNQVHDVKNKTDCEILSEYCKRPVSDATLIMLSDLYQIDKRLDSVVPKEQKRVFWELFENQKQSWISNYFRSAGITITAEAVDLLLEHVENNTQELKQVCERLALFLKDEKTISEDLVEDLVYHSREENVFTLFDRIAQGSFSSSLEILQNLRHSGATDPSQLLGGLLWQFRRLLTVRRMIDARYSLDDAYRKLKIRGKKNQRVYAVACDVYTAGQLERIFTLFSEYETQLRSNSGNMQDIYLKLFLYDVVLKKGTTAIIATPDY
ncbi:MAG: DNA polymerase III subunit delta [Spirochaetales bacterium]|nr:DNA polymerase III subunit delta [Spirochaetales bacterium]